MTNLPKFDGCSITLKFPKFHKFFTFDEKGNGIFVTYIQFSLDKEDFRQFETILSQFWQQRNYAKNSK